MKRKTIVFSLLLLACLGLNLSLITAQENLQARGLDVIGYGYDVFGNYADQSSRKPYPLFDLGSDRPLMIGAYEFQVPQGVMLENISSHKTSSTEGESLREYARDMSLQVGLSGDSMFFSGSINTSFSQAQSGSQRNYFYTYRDAITKWRVSLLQDSVELRDHLLPQARRDINTMEPRTLFERYGAYYIAKAYLGGRAEYNVTMQASEESSMEQFGLAVEASYRSISADTSYNSSTSQSSSEMFRQAELTVIGGASEFASDISNPDQYRAWAEGIKDWPVLCDFEPGSLRPIWDLADSPARRSELQQAFEEMKREHPLPKAFVDIMALESGIFMVQNVSTGLYWDLRGYHFNAQSEPGSWIVSWEPDAYSAREEGLDRYIRVVANEFQPEFVMLQPQHTEMVAALDPGSSRVVLGELNLRNDLTQFEMIPVDDMPEVYRLRSKSNGLYVTSQGGDNGSPIVLAELSDDETQLWEFHAKSPSEVAPPMDGAYTVRSSFSNGRGWEYSGVYPSIYNTSLQIWEGHDEVADRVYEVQNQGNGSFASLRPFSHPHAYLSHNPGEAVGLTDFPGRDPGAEQQWKFIYAGAPRTYYVISRSDENMAISLDPTNGLSNGAAVTTQGFVQGEHQQWQFNKTNPVADENLIYQGSYHILTHRNHLFLEIQGHPPANNQDDKNIIVWSQHDEDDGRVRFIPQANGSYVIEFQHGGRVMDLASGSSSNGANIQLWRKLGNAQQQWFLDFQHGDVFRIISAQSGKAVDISTGGDFERGDNVHQYRPHGGVSQQWELHHADGPRNGQSIMNMY